VVDDYRVARDEGSTQLGNEHMLGGSCGTSLRQGEPYKGRLDLRAPEDRFANDDQVEARFEEPIDAPEIEGAILAFMRAWHAGDDEGLKLAAADVVSRTRSYYQRQGVPAFAHPILPPQLARMIAKTIQQLPDRVQGAVTDDTVGSFGDSLRLGIEQELSAYLSDAREDRDNHDQGHIDDLFTKPKAFGCGCSCCSGR
jgi:hypothetical protein